MERSTVLLRTFIVLFVTQQTFAAPATFNVPQNGTNNILSSLDSPLSKENDTSIPKNSDNLKDSVLQIKLDTQEKVSSEKSKEGEENPKSFNYQNNVLNNALMSTMPILKFLNGQTNFDINLMDPNFKMSPTIHVINNMNSKNFVKQSEIEKTDTKNHAEKLLDNTFDSILSKPLPPFFSNEESDIKKSKRINPTKTSSGISKGESSKIEEPIEKPDLVKKNESKVKIDSNINQNNKNIEKDNVQFKTISNISHDHNSAGADDVSIRKGKYLNNGYEPKTESESGAATTGHDSAGISQGREESKNKQEIQQASTLNVTSDESNKRIINVNNLNEDALSKQGNLGLQTENSQQKVTNSQIAGVNGLNTEKKLLISNVKKEKTDNQETKTLIQDSTSQGTDKILYVVENNKTDKNVSDTEYNIENLPTEFFKNVPRKLKITPDKSVQLALERELNALNAFTKVSENGNNLEKNSGDEKKIDKNISNNSEQSKINIKDSNAQLNKLNLSPVIPSTVETDSSKIHSPRTYDKEVIAFNQTRNIMPIKSEKMPEKSSQDKIPDLNEEIESSSLNKDTNLSKNIDKPLANDSPSSRGLVKFNENSKQSKKDEKLNTNETNKENDPIPNTQQKGKNEFENESKSSNEQSSINLDKHQDTTQNLNKFDITRQTSNIESNSAQYPDSKSPTLPGSKQTSSVKPKIQDVKWIQIEPAKVDENKNSNISSKLAGDNIGTSKTNPLVGTSREARVGDINIDQNKTFNSEDSKLIRIVSSSDKVVSKNIEKTTVSDNESFVERSKTNAYNTPQKSQFGVSEINKEKQTAAFESNKNHGNNQSKTRPSVSEENNIQNKQNENNVRKNPQNQSQRNFNTFPSIPPIDSQVTSTESSNRLTPAVENKGKGGAFIRLQTDESNYYEPFNRKNYDNKENTFDRRPSRTKERVDLNSKDTAEGLRISLNDNISRNINQESFRSKPSTEDLNNVNKNIPQTTNQNARGRNNQGFRSRNSDSTISSSAQDESLSKYSKSNSANIDAELDLVRGSKKYQPTKFETISPYITDSQTSQIYSETNPSSIASNFYVTPRPNHIVKQVKDNTLLGRNNLPKITDIRENSEKTQSSRPYRGNIKFVYEPSNYDWQYDDINYPTQFSYKYKAPNDTSVYQKGVLKEINNRKVFVVHGSYKYTAPDGTPILVTYTADENGFHPQERVLESSKSEEIEDSDELESEILLEGLQQNSLAAREFRKTNESPQPETTTEKEVTKVGRKRIARRRT